MTNTIDIENILKGFKSYIEWDDCTEQFILTIVKEEFTLKEKIFSIIRPSFIVDEWTNGHGFIVSPKSVRDKMDNSLPEWYFTLIERKD